MPPAVDLTGAWSADDGATYYIRQLSDGSVSWGGLNHSGFHTGMEFTNVFRGRVSADGRTLTGDWADVPRGEILGTGKLSLEIVRIPAAPPVTPFARMELIKKPQGTTGGFGAKVWKSGGRPSGPFPLGPQDIGNLAGRVQRYDVPLGENNPPCRDFSVMWGTVGKINGPTFPPKRNDYCSFVDGDWDGDGDFAFDLQPDFSRLEPDFWTGGWVDRSFDASAANEHILSLYDHFDRFHCEAAMYARQNDEHHCDQGRSFANVFHGTVTGTVIEGTWVDVSMGAGGARSAGSLTLHGGALSTELMRVSQTGFFGGSTWTKLYDIETQVTRLPGVAPPR